MVARGRTWLFDDLGDGTHGEAEWLALCLALKVAQELGEPHFDLLGDSRSVIDQARGRLPCRSSSARFCRKRYLAAAACWPPRRLRWIKRSQNLAGIALDRRSGR